MATVLIVDDERSIRVTLSAFLSRAAAHTVLAAECVEDALPLLASQPVDVVLTDILLPGRSGLELLHEVHQHWPRIPVIVMTGEPSQDTARAAIRDRAFDYLVKPVGLDVVTATVARALEAKRHEDDFERLQAENRDYREHLERLVEERTAQLRNREREFRTLAENFPDVIARFDRQFRHLYVNPAIERYTGRPAADFLGKTNEELGMPGENLAEWNRKLQRVFETGVQEAFEFAFAGTGVPQIFTSLLVPEPSSAGTIESVLCITRDITERKRADAALRESEARLRALFDNSMVGFMLTAPDGRILAANPAACRILGRTEAEIGRVGRAGVVDEQDPHAVALLAARQKHGRAEGEMTMIRGDGTRFPAEVSSALFTTAEGIRACVVFREVLAPGCQRE